MMMRPINVGFIILDKTIKAVFHFNRIVQKRSVFLCFLSSKVKLITSTPKKMLRYFTLEMENWLKRWGA